MTQEIKDKLEQAADKRYHPASDHREHYVAGAQTILENPEEWGLFTPDQMKGQRKHNHVETWYESHIQKEKYREVLERLLEENLCSHAGDGLIKETLKHESKD